MHMHLYVCVCACACVCKSCANFISLNGRINLLENLIKFFAHLTSV